MEEGFEGSVVTAESCVDGMRVLRALGRGGFFCWSLGSG